MTELATIKKQLPMLGLDDWDEIRKVEATLEAYRKYASQDRDLRDKSLQIGEATIRLKWHKGRILAEMEKNRGVQNQLAGGSIVQPPDDKPTYSDLGIDKTSTARPRGQALQIGEATIRLKWHKGRILGEIEKNRGTVLGGSRVQPPEVKVCGRMMRPHKPIQTSASTKCKPPANSWSKKHLTRIGFLIHEAIHAGGKGKLPTN